MSKLPHGWLCDNGDSELAGEIAEYLFCWGQNSTAALQARYDADDMVHRFVAVLQGRRTTVSYLDLMQQAQLLGNWLAGF